MDEPVAGLLIGDDDGVDALSRPEQHGVLEVARGERLRVARDHELIVPVRVHRVHVLSGDVDPAQPHAVAFAHLDRRGRGILLAVDGEVVLRGALDRPRREDLDVVPLHALFRARMRRQDDDRAVEATVEHLFVVVRVVDERAGLPRDKRVTERSTRWDHRLRDPGDAVHRVGGAADPVQVDRIRDRERVAVVDHDALALPHDERRSRNDAVVRPRHHDQARTERPGRFARDEMEGRRVAGDARHRRERAVGALRQHRLAGRRRRGRDRSGERLGPDGRRVDRRHRLVRVSEGPQRARHDQPSAQNDRGKDRGKPNR
jgi:hypothetical protein